MDLKREKRILRIQLIILELVLILFSALLITLICITKADEKKLDNEEMRVRAYNEVVDSDADIENCDYVKFSSFFIRDVDGDGYAERYDGTCNQLSKKATLYFDLNVLTDGRLENGKITINGKNFNLSTTLVRDEVLKNDYIGNDTTQIELNTVNFGTQKLFSGYILSDIGNNVNNYSVEDNKVILTGTWVSTDGTRTVDIHKEINLTADWYGKTSTTSYPYITTSHNLNTALGTDDVTLSFSIGYRETAQELIIQKQLTEVTIPDLNGFAPTEVIVTSQNCTYEYDEETRLLSVERNATVSDTGSVTSSVSRDNTYTVQVKYPLEAYESLGKEVISITVPTKGYYYGYNNSSEAFTSENPYISSYERSWTHTWSIPQPVVSSPWFDTEIGRYVYNPDTNSYRYIVSKELPIELYNGLELEEGKIDTYVVEWRGYTGNTLKDLEGMHMEEAQPDRFLNSNNEYSSMKDYIKTKGVYFSNLGNILGDDGWVKLYDVDTNELLETFTKDNWNQYTSSNPYYFENVVKGIKIETSAPKQSSYLYVYQIKEIDDEKLTTEIPYEQFENLNYIYTYLKGDLINNGTQAAVSNPSARAYYEAPVSLASFSVSPYAISNQETKTVNMKISTETSRYNEAKWKNGEFVIEMPDEILEVVINDINCSNSNVEIISYEKYEENGKQYIKIYTKNDEDASFSINVNADITADPRKATVSKPVKLYAINEKCPNYRETSRTSDVLDINGNGNTAEYVLYKTSSMQIIAPASLLTSQTLSNFDDKGTEVVSPQTAILDKADRTRDAQLNVTVTNNYTGTVSEARIVGEIPFEGNKYQINGKDLGSTYSVTMKNTGITVPEKLASIAKVYYSTNEKVTDDLLDPVNNWKTAEEVTDWSQIKTYAIDLNGYVLQKNDSFTFSYGIEIPGNINYNDVTYSTHGVYFCLDTEDGKLKTKTEVNRLGIMIAKKFDLNLVKYKTGTNTKVQGATYKLTEGSNSRTGVTDENGNAIITGLYVDKEYTLREIQSPDSYILNEDEVKFKVTVDNEGNPQVNIISGTLRDTAAFSNVDGIYTLNMNVEDVAKYDVKILKTNLNTNENIKGAKFKLTGGVYGTNGRIFTSNIDGEIMMANLVPGTEYTLQETKADGYYVIQEPITFTVSRNSDGVLIINSENEFFTAANIVEEDGVAKATVNVNIKNEPIPTYSLNINKKDNKGGALANTQFKLTSTDTGEVLYGMTDNAGRLVFEGLYQFVEGRYVTGEYTLQEVLATEGYITDKTEVKFKAVMEEVTDEPTEEGAEPVTRNVLRIDVLEGEDIIVSSASDETSITFDFENKPIFKLTKTGDNDQLLPNAKFKVVDLNGNFAVDVNGDPIGELVGSAPIVLNFNQVTETESLKWTKLDDGTWQSGAKGQDSKTSTIVSDEIVLAKEGTLTFDWAVSSESASYDYLYYTIKDLDKNAVVIGGKDDSSVRIGGNDKITKYEDLQFNTKEVNLIPGRYQVEFTYRKDSSQSKGMDAGFIRNAQIAGSGYYALTTDENGELSANLAEGLYKVIEIEAPEGYDLPENEEDRTYYVGIGANRPEESEFKVKFAKSISGNGHSNIYDILATSDGGYIVAGSFSGEVDFDKDGTVDETAVGNFDAFAAKFNSKGEKEWHYTYGTNGADEFNGIDIASDGYILAGYEYGDNFEDGLLIKIDNSGSQVWKKSFVGDLKDEIRNVKVLSTGDIAIVGRYYGSSLNLDGATLTNSVNYYAGFVACYASDGTYKWSQEIKGNNNVNVTDVTETNLGIVVSVDFLGKLNVNGTDITSKGNQDIMLIGYSLEGAYQWHKQIGGSNDESVVRLMTDNEDNVIAVGGFASNLTIGEGDTAVTITAPTTSYSSSLVLKYSSIGEYISEKHFGGTGNDDKLTAAVQTSDGGMLYSGWFYNATKFDIDGDGTNDITTNKGSSDALLVKFNDLDELEWVKPIAGSSYDSAYGAAQLSDETFITVGNFDSTSLAVGDATNVLASTGYTDGFMIDLGRVITAAEIPAVQEVEAKNELKKFKITTEIGENSDKERVGGTITGEATENENIKLVEEVKYNYDSLNQIVITPDTDYSVYSVTINGEKASFTPNAEGVVIIPVFEKVQSNYHIRVVFEKDLSNVIVHHYLKDKQGNYTTQSLADDEYYTGKIDSSYSTSPKIDIEGYELEKAEDGNYLMPENRSGKYTAATIEVTYYYEESPVSLIVHHYLEGTETSLADDEVSNKYKGDNYETSAKSELLDRYDLIEDLTTVNPETAGTSGVIQENTVVTYYYKLKEYKITTKVNPVTVTKFNENTQQSEEVTLKGGTISGENDIVYETVSHGNNSVKEIKAIPDDGYSVNKITVNGTEIEFTRESDGSVILEQFENVLENKEVVVEFIPLQGNLVIHHYLVGTETPITFDDGTEVQEETRTGYVGDPYATKKVESTLFELVTEPENASGKYAEGTTVVNYYYRRIPAKVIVHHYIEGTTTKLVDDVIIDGVVKENYTTGVASVDNKYEVVEIPSNANGQMTKEDIEVTYYYRLKDTSVLVHYYIEGTTTSLSEDITINGKVDDSYTTKSAEDIPSKYELVAEPSNKNGTMTVEQTVVTYYYRLKETGVVVHYYKEGTTDKLSEDVTINGRVDDSYTTKSAEDIPSKYELVSEPSNKNGTMTEAQIVVIYYYRLKDTSVVVHHYKEGTTDSLSADVTIDGQVDDEYTTVAAEDIPSKYELVATPENATGTMVEAQTVVTYYYRLKDTSVLVHHYIDGTTTSLSADVTINGQVDDEYQTTVATDVPSKYELVEMPENATGTMVEAQTVVTYYYRLKDTSVLVHHYIEGTTTSLSADVTINGKVDDEYTTNVATDIPSKYELVAEPSNKNGTMLEQQIVVIYYYRLKDTKVTVHHYIIGTTTSLSADVTINGQVDDEYTTNSATDIPSKYELVSEPSNKNGTMTEEPIVVIYYYRLKDTSVIVHHYIEGTTDKLSEDVTIDGQVDDKYKTVVANDIPEYYELVEEPANKEGTMTIESIEVVYYYKLKQYPYVVNYLEKSTNKVLHEQKQGGNNTYGTKIDSSEEVIDIDGYKYDSVNTDELTINVTGNIINVYYVKRNDLSYKVNYLEKGTDRVLSTQKVQTGMTFEDVVKAEDEVIDIDGFNYDSVDKDELTITTGENVINIYYTKRNDLSYKVNYLEKNTNRVLSTQKVQTGMTFEDVVKAEDEVIDIDGYNYDSVDKDELVIGTGENVINIYYTKRNDLSYKVNYLEKNTGRVLENQKVVGNMTFKDVVKSEDEVIDIDGFNYDSVDKDELTITTCENVINIYYVKRNDLSYKVNYLEKNTNRVLSTQKVQTGMTFEDVVKAEDEVIDIDGFNYDSVDKDELTITTGENVINIYYVKRNDLSYTVNYLEEVTNKVLHDPKVVNNVEFESVITSSDEAIEINGYNYAYPDKDELKITTGENVINIYYNKVEGLSYTVNYLEKGTNKVLFPANIQGNMTFEDVVKAEDEVIDVDGYNYDSVDKDELIIGTGENVINIYYIKRNDLSYKVNYLEKGTNRVLSTQKVQTGMTFEDVVKAEDEVIDIDGFNYDSVDKDELIIGTGENVINIYYTKRNDLSYKVNYLEKGTNRVLSTQKFQTGMTFEAVVKASDEVIDIDGFKYDSVDKDELTITTGENVINIYYIKRNDLSYKVNYLEKNTGRILNEQKKVNGVTFEDVITSSDEVIDIDGFKYDSVDKDELKITTGENVINIYYVKRNDLSYKVNYLEKNTNRVLKAQKVQTGMTFEDVVKAEDEVIDIDGFNYDSVDKDELKITTGENVINIYYVKRNDLSYKVNYLEKNTNRVLAAQKVQTGMTFETVVKASDEVVEIDGFNYDSVDKDELKIITGENVINIYYVKRNDLSYKVNYLEKGTNKVLNKQKVINNVTFESVIKASKEVISINGYKYDSVDKDELKITTGENVINIYYTKRNDLSYKVNYLEKNTNRVLAKQKIQTEMIFKAVVKAADEVIEIDGFKYDSVDKNELKITTGENVINIYYVKRNDLSYKVNYLEKDTDKVLKAQKIVNGVTFENVITSSNEIVSIDGYNYDSVDKNELKITTGENVINIYYTKRDDLSYKVNYLEKGTNRVLHKQKVVEDMVFETEIESSKEIITINGFKFDNVDKDKLVISTGENVINIYYTKVNGLSYTVNYLEKGTNRVLHAPKTQENQTFEDEIIAKDEIININGFKFDSTDKDKLVIGTSINEITIYYTKRSDLTYIVKYVDKDTKEEIHEQKLVEEVIFEDEIIAVDEVIEIDGYNFDSTDKEKLVISTNVNEITIFYTKKNDLTYVVNYLEKDTNEKIHDSKLVENKTFKDVVKSADEIIDIYGYNYDSVDKDELVILTSENVINIYYTKKDTKVTVHYYEEGTTNKVSEDVTISGKVFDDYKTKVAEDVPSKYELVKVPDNSKGTMTEDEIVVIYYYRKKPTKVIVHHYEEGTNNKLSENVVINGRVDDKYTTNSATDVPSKYELVEEPSNKIGIMLETTVEVTYYYRVRDTKLNIRYLEKGSNKELAKPEVQTGKVEEDYITDAKVIEGYTLVGDSGNTTGKLTIKPITVTFYYLQNTKVIVNHINQITNEILDTYTKNGLVGDKYTANSKNFEEYILVEKPSTETVIMTKDEIILNYYYVPSEAHLIEKHIDVISGSILFNTEHEGTVGDEYDIPAKQFAGYDLVEDKLPINAKGKMTVKPIEVIYYYSYKTNVTAKYIDKITGKEIVPEEKQVGHEGDEYTTERKELEDYVLVEVPKNSNGKMTKEPIKVVYYYIHKSAGVVEKHIDIATKELLATESHEGLEGDEYDIPSRQFTGYDLVREKLPSNSKGKMTIKPIEVVYYYTYKTNVTTKYIDKVTGEAIVPNEKQEGHEGDTYTTEEKEIPGYDLVAVPENKEGIMTKEPIDVIYYYVRPAKVVVNHIDTDTNKTLADEEVIEGHEADAYETAAKEIKYYKLLEDKLPANAKGNMKVEVVEDVVNDTTYVNYYYRKMIFNLKADKIINSITINGKTLDINGDLGKVEIYRKEINSAKVQISYKIKVTNNSELKGKAKLLESIPAGTAMIGSSNPEWTIKGSTATLETDEINPGESREYIVILDWVNGEENIGKRQNVVEIISSENEAGYDEDTKDNKDTADLIVTVSTGTENYIVGTSIMLVVLAGLSVVLVKKSKQNN